MNEENNFDPGTVENTKPPVELIDKRKPYKYAYQYRMPDYQHPPHIAEKIGQYSSNMTLEYTELTKFSKECALIKREFKSEVHRDEVRKLERMVAVSKTGSASWKAKQTSPVKAVQQPEPEYNEPVPSTSKCDPPSTLSTSKPSLLGSPSGVTSTTKPRRSLPLDPTARFLPLIKKLKGPVPKLTTRFHGSPQRLFGRIRSSLGGPSEQVEVQMPLSPLPVKQSIIKSSEDESEDFVNIEPDPRDMFQIIEQRSCIDGQEVFIRAESRELNEMVAVRIRTGTSAHSEWMNELQTYLLPDFRHNNILEFFGADIRHSTDKARYVPNYGLVRVEEDEEVKEGDGERNWLHPECVRVEFWLMNRFTNCITLRDYLRRHKLYWEQMLFIATGIVSGLDFLHENQDYQNIDVRRAIDSFVMSTNGAIEKVVFGQEAPIYMQPFFKLSVIHRNLSSLNIVLKRNLTPCIWNFGAATIFHPFQPSNAKQYIDDELKETLLTSPYSPPEVLQERGHMTLSSMKAVDMYACGIIFWELMSRCVLPKLVGASEDETRERSIPLPYNEPYERDFQDIASRFTLSKAVCDMRCRPKILISWLAGRKTNLFVQLMQDLWDHDYDARLPAYAVLNRLKRMNRSDQDVLFKYFTRLSKHFVRPKKWPPRESTLAAPFPRDWGPNLVIEKL